MFHKLIRIIKLNRLKQLISAVHAVYRINSIIFNVREVSYFKFVKNGSKSIVSNKSTLERIMRPEKTNKWIEPSRQKTNTSNSPSWKDPFSWKSSQKFRILIAIDKLITAPDYRPDQQNKPIPPCLKRMRLVVSDVRSFKKLTNQQYILSKKCKRHIQSGIKVISLRKH